MINGLGTGKVPLCAKVCVVDEDRDDVNLRLGTWEGNVGVGRGQGQGCQKVIMCQELFPLALVNRYDRQQTVAATNLNCMV